MAISKLDNPTSKSDLALVTPAPKGTIRPEGYNEAQAVLTDAIACRRTVAETVQNCNGSISKAALAVLKTSGYEVDIENLN